MKELKAIFRNDLSSPLKYTLNKMIPLEDHYGLFKMQPALKSEVDNPTDDLFYSVTNENKILETIYPDKIRVYEQVLKGIYKPRENKNNLVLKKVKRK